MEEIKLPESWQWKTMRELVKYSKGKKPQLESKTKTAELSIPYINTKYLRFNQIETYSKQEKNLILVENNEVLLLWDGANAGEFFLGKYGLLSSTMVILKPLNNNLNLKYLYYMLKTNEPELRQFVQGTGIPHVSKEIFNSLEIPIPYLDNQKKSLEVQQKIVDKLDKFFEEYEKLKEEKQKAIKNYDQILAAAISKLIPSNENELPEGWEEKRLEEISEIKGGKRLPKGNNLVVEKTNYPYIRVTDFNNNSVDIDSIKYITEDVHNKIKNYCISKDDVYISIAGTIGLVGTVPKELDGANLTENAAKCTNLKTISNEYLKYYLSSSNSQQKFNSVKVATGVSKLSLFRIKKLTIGIPYPNEPKKSLEIQNQIVEEIKKAKELQDKIREEQVFIQNQLEDLPKSVLAKAFRGELI